MWTTRLLRTKFTGGRMECGFGLKSISVRSVPCIPRLHTLFRAAIGSRLHSDPLPVAGGQGLHGQSAGCSGRCTIHPGNSEFPHKSAEFHLSVDQIDRLTIRCSTGNAGSGRDRILNCRRTFRR